MENQEYIIISKTALLKRIEELEKEVAFYNKVGALHLNPNKVKVETELSLLKQILSQSTPLIPEIEKAFNNGVFYSDSNLKAENYISNLKLDI